jgi:hypothetical protein
MIGHDSTRRPGAMPRRRTTAVGLALLGILAIGSASVAQSATSDAAATVPIPLTSLGELSSLDATVTLDASGEMRGEAMEGDLTIDLTSNAQRESRIDITGSLLGPVAAQVGGKLVGLFRPRAVSVYTVEDGTYVVVSGLTDVCVKPGDNAATEALAQLSPQSLMTLLTSSDVAQGTLVGDEAIEGLPVQHWTIEGEGFLAAARASDDPTVQAFGQSLRSAADADLYVASDGGYPVRYRGGFSGAYEPLGLDGDFDVQIDLTGIDTNTPVTLPGACDHPISR